MTALDSTYAKPFLTVPEQILRLRERGMDCGTDAYATAELERYGYYRLSGYWHLYRMRPEDPAAQFDDEGREIRLDTFVEGTSLSHVVALYDFDQQLRARLSDALSTLEVSLRFFVGHRLGKIDKFSHRDPQALGAVREAEPGGLPEPTTSYLEWLEEYDRHEKRARDSFVLHFRKKYGPHLPIWVATEVMSFGVLSSLYSLMPQADQEILAARFQINTADGRGDRGAFANWLNNLRNVRNICAHFGRTWNRAFDVLIDAPGQSRRESAGLLVRLVDSNVSNKLYGVLVIMRHLMLSVDPGRSDICDIANFIEAESRTVGFGLHQLGFPPDWRTDPIWSPGTKLDPEPMMAASLLDRTNSLTTVGARAALYNAEVEQSDSPRTVEQEGRARKAAQRKLLRTYLHYDVLIEIDLGGVKYYPDFQFRDGSIVDALAEVNKELSSRCVEASSVQTAVALLDWWQSANPDLPVGEDGMSRSPIELLQAVPEEEFDAVMAQKEVLNRFVIPRAPGSAI